MSIAQKNKAPLDPILVQWRRRIFVSTWLCYAGLYFCRKPFYVAKGQLGETFGWDASFLGLLGTVYLITYTLGQFIAGFAGTIWGPRLILLVGMSLSIFSNVMFGFTDSAVTFALFMGLNGLAQSTGWANTVGNMANWYRKSERGKVMGIWATCYQVGGVLGAGLAALVLGIYGFKYSFFSGSLVLLVVMIFFIFNQKNNPEDIGLSLEQQDGDAANEKPQSKPKSVNPFSLKALGWNKKVVTTITLVGVFYFFVKFIRYALWSWVPFLLFKNYQMEGEQAGYMSTLFDMFGIVGVIFAGWVSDKYANSRRTGVSLCMLFGMVIGCAMLYFWGQTSIFGFGLCLSIIGFSLYGPDALMTGAGAQDIGNIRGATLSAAVINGMGSVGAVSQEIIIGKLYDTSDGEMGPIFFILMASACCSAFSLWIIRAAKLSKV